MPDKRPAAPHESSRVVPPGRMALVNLGVRGDNGRIDAGGDGMGSQFVVDVDDRPGALSHLAHVLAVEGVNIEHIAGIGGRGEGHVVLTVSDDAAARSALRKGKYRFTEGIAVLVTVDDHPGALAATTELLANAGVNVASVLVTGHHRGRVDLAFTVDDPEKARSVLGARPVHR